ncbi:hypothetical protein MOSE0_B05622 [Monosporozyma servazzii]
MNFEKAPLSMHCIANCPIAQFHFLRNAQPSLYTVLYYTVLYYTVLYYTVLYYTILFYTVLYYTIL